jgi:hypothetical protein
MMNPMLLSNRWLAVLPMTVPLYLWFKLIGNPLPLCYQWLTTTTRTKNETTLAQQLIAYMIIAMIGYATTQKLVPHIQQYTLRKHICGKDLGKRGTATADVPM